MNVTISGTRSTHDRHEVSYYDAFRVSLLPLAMGDAKFLVGGAIGMDYRALGYLLELGKAHNVTIVVPATLERQPEQVKGRLYDAISQGARIVELHAPDFPSGRAYHARNRWMLNRSAFGLFYPQLDQPHKGGTWELMEVAIEKDMPRTVIPVPGGLKDLNARMPVATRNGL